MPRFRHAATFALLLAGVAMSSAQAAQNAGDATISSAPAASLSYADMADMALAAPIVAGVQIRKASRLKGELAAGVPAGSARLLVEADTQTLLRGAGGLAARVTYLVDVPLDQANRAPKLRKARMLLLAAAGREGELRLIAPRAQIPWTPGNEAQLRAILTASVAADAPPRITGVGNAFHVPGSLPGESETQIFLTTANGRPVSVGVLRRPGEMNRWMVSLGEMLDDSAAPPAPNTLLWYRLACFLPPELPQSSLRDMDDETAQATRNDYMVVIEGLGPCGRSTAP